jgi:hypothetical protein
MVCGTEHDRSFTGGEIMSRRNAVWVLALALGVGLLAASATEARPGGKKPPSPFSSQIVALDAANALLAKADHDYKGHRVKAMKEVHAAIHALKVGAKAPKNPFKGPKSTGGLPQDQSDALLKQAMDRIAAVQTQLATVQDPRATTATAALTAAVTQLQTALKIK